MNDQPHQHKWEFACQLRDEEVVVTTTNIEVVKGQKLERQQVISKPKDYYKLLFYCECGALKTLDVSYGAINTSGVELGYRL